MQVIIAHTSSGKTLLTQAVHALVTGEVSRVKGWEWFGKFERAEPLAPDEYFRMFRKSLAYAAIQLASREFEEQYETRPDYCIDEVRVRPMQLGRPWDQLGCDWINQRVQEVLTEAGLAHVVFTRS